jgi:hypothetical protein
VAIKRSVVTSATREKMMRKFKISAHSFEDESIKSISIIEASNIIEALDVFENDNPFLMPDEIVAVKEDA